MLPQIRALQFMARIGWPLKIWSSFALFRVATVSLSLSLCQSVGRFAADGLPQIYPQRRMRQNQNRICSELRVTELKSR